MPDPKPETATYAGPGLKGTLRTLTTTFATDGTVRWIGTRPERHAPMLTLTEAMILSTGVEGDRRTAPGKRAVSLIQWEHLAVIAALIGRADLPSQLPRRNIAVSGINLLGLRKLTFRIGDAILQGTGLCAPCSRMETTLGPGGYTAMRGHGGITAEVITPGPIALGSPVVPLL